MTEEQKTIREYGEVDPIPTNAHLSLDNEIISQNIDLSNLEMQCTCIQFLTSRINEQLEVMRKNSTIHRPDLSKYVEQTKDRIDRIVDQLQTILAETTVHEYFCQEKEK